MLQQQAKEDIRNFGHRLIPLDADDATVVEFDFSNSSLNENNLAILKTRKVLQTSSLAI